MRALLTCLLIGCAGPAQAMNWEGHDDWMSNAGPAQIYREAVPQAEPVPQPSVGCSDRGRSSVGNPYEQIPLAGHDCRAMQEEREVER